MTDVVSERTLNGLIKYPQRPVDAIEALEAIATMDGDVTYAAAFLKTSPNMVVAAIVGQEGSHAMLARYLRAYTMLKTFGIVNKLATAVEDSIEELAPKDVASTFTKLVEGMARLTDAPEQAAADPFAAVLRQLPPHIREAVLAAADATPDDVAMVTDTTIVDTENAA